MIALLGCSNSLLGSSIAYPFTGELIDDSVLVSYNDLRLANSKLIQLEYEKQINNKLKEIISNDSIIIKEYSNNTKEIINENKKVKVQRNGLGAIAGVFLFIIIGLL